jgi:HEAT repeat protein
MPRSTEEERASFESALRSVAEEGPIPQAELDALSVLEGGDLARFRAVWAGLSAAARARLIRALHGAALERLRLDFSALNQLALGDADPRVRLAGVECAIEDRSSALLEKLLELLRSDPVGEIRAAAAEDLARFALLAELDDLDAATTARLRQALRAAVADAAEEPRVRTAALAALGYFSDVETAEQLARAFSDPVLRLGAVRGMGRTADPRWTDRLMPVLGSDDPQMRLEAARALGEIEDERAVGPLVEVIDDPEASVRGAVIEALGHIGGEEAREALLYAAEDPRDDVREAAERALEELEAAEADPLDLA